MPKIEKRPPQRAVFVNGPQKVPLPPNGNPPMHRQRQVPRPADAPPRRPILYPTDDKE